MSFPSAPPSILISALASKPHLAMLALDCLSEQGDPPGKVLTLHTDAHHEPTHSGLATLNIALTSDYASIRTHNLANAISHIGSL